MSLFLLDLFLDFLILEFEQSLEDELILFFFKCCKSVLLPPSLINPDTDFLIVDYPYESLKSFPLED